MKKLLHKQKMPWGIRKKDTPSKTAIAITEEI